MPSVLGIDILIKVLALSNLPLQCFSKCFLFPNPLTLPFLLRAWTSHSMKSILHSVGRIIFLKYSTFLSLKCLCPLSKITTSCPPYSLQQSPPPGDLSSHYGSLHSDIPLKHFSNFVLCKSFFMNVFFCNSLSLKAESIPYLFYPLYSAQSRTFSHSRHSISAC